MRRFPSPGLSQVRGRLGLVLVCGYLAALAMWFVPVPFGQAVAAIALLLGVVAVGLVSAVAVVRGGRTAGDRVLASSLALMVLALAGGLSLWLVGGDAAANDATPVLMALFGLSLALMGPSLAVRRDADPLARLSGLVCLPFGIAFIWFGVASLVGAR